MSKPQSLRGNPIMFLILFSKTQVLEPDDFSFKTPQINSGNIAYSYNVKERADNCDFRWLFLSNL